MAPLEKLAALGILLPTPMAPVGTYVPVCVSGGFAVVSGQLPMQDGKLTTTGLLGQDVSPEAGYAAARLCLINVFAQLNAAVPGGLNAVRQIVRLGGFIAATSSFATHAAVMNGASDLAVEVFGDAGRHSRSTIGVSSLPLSAAVEVEGMFWLG